MFRRKQKETRPIAKTLWYALCNSWIQLGGLYKIRMQRTSIYASRRILYDSPSMFCVLVTDAAYLWCPRDLEKIRDIVKLQADRNMFSRAANSVSDGEEILRCKELIDQGFKRFEVSMTLVKIFGAMCVIQHHSRSTRQLHWEWTRYMFSKALMHYGCSILWVIIFSHEFPHLKCLHSIPTKHQHRIQLIMVIVYQIPLCHRSQWLQKFFLAVATLSLISHLLLYETSKQNSPY